ncbi:MAG: ureidoglycolate lyase [Sphaerochaetaceae bacterium]|nr:ureidoglycolate lyase [Sphaerochaetaceae bacterium]
MKKIELECLHACDGCFSEYGQFITTATRAADAAGEELSFWNKLAVMDHNGATSISIVQTYGHHGLEEHTLEQHSNTSEVLIPTNDIIIVVALSEKERHDRPDLESVKAFRVPKGSAVRLKKGVWHHAPLTTEAVTNTFVLFYENTPEEDFLAYELEEEFNLYFVVKP